jgi:hypothetical protein
MSGKARSTSLSKVTKAAPMRDANSTKRVSQTQAYGAFLPRQHAGPDRHPEDIGHFGFPLCRGDRFGYGLKAVSGFVDEGLAAEQKVRARRSAT